MRPSNAILDEFYDLANLDENKRFKAVLSLSENLKQNGDYCMSRLVGGLASSRAAARLGYCTAIAHLLPIAREDWPASRLFKLADMKLSKQNAETSACAIGHHLLHTAMISCNLYLDDVSELVDRELSIFDSNRLFGFAVCHSLANLSMRLTSSSFKSDVLPKIKEKVCLPLGSISPEWFFFILSIRTKFPGMLKKNIEWFSSAPLFNPSIESCQEIIGLLKKVDTCARESFIGLILAAGLDSDTFSEVYKNIIEKWMLSGDVEKVYCRAFELVEKWLNGRIFNPKHVLSVFSPELIDLFHSAVGAKNTDRRFLQSRIECIMQSLKKLLESGKWKRSYLIDLLERFDTARGGKFDEIVDNKSRITECIISQFDLKGIRKFLNKPYSKEEWSLRRMVGSFRKWPDDVKSEFLSQICNFEVRSEQTHSTFCNCIDSLFVIKLRAGRNVKVELADNDIKMLNDVLKCRMKTKTPELENRAILVLYVVLQLWSLSVPVEKEQQFYLTAAEEVLTFPKELDSDSKDNTLSAIVDLLLSLLSRPRRYHRSLVHYVFASLLPQMGSKTLLHILETINLPDDRILCGDDDDGEDEEYEDEKEDSDAENDSTTVELENGNAGEAGHSSSDEETSVEVDHSFVKKVKAALGNADATWSDDSAGNDEEEKASVSSDLSDNTMFRLDEGLSAAFREQLKGMGKLSQYQLDQARQFRIKCLDLLLIAVSSDESQKQAIEILLPLLDSAINSLRNKNGDLVFKRVTRLLEMIMKHKKVDVSEKKIAKNYDRLISMTSKIVNPILRNVVGSISGYLFSISCHSEGNAVSNIISEKVKDIFSRYMTQTNNEIISEIAVTPFTKYPRALLSYLPNILDFAFNEELRIFKRTEALSCVVSFMRKDVLNAMEQDKKLFKKLTSQLGNHLHNYFSSFDPENGKPRFFAYAIRLVISFAQAVKSETKECLQILLSDDLKTLCDNQELWKEGGKMKRFNSSAHSVCNRSAQAALTQAAKLVQTSSASVS